MAVSPPFESKLPITFTCKLEKRDEIPYMSVSYVVHVDEKGEITISDIKVDFPKNIERLKKDLLEEIKSSFIIDLERGVIIPTFLHPEKREKAFKEVFR